MKKINYSYIVYVILLCLLLVCRYFGILSQSVVMMVYLIILMIEFTICFGGFNNKQNPQPKNKKKTKQDDSIAIKPLLTAATPLIIFFIINYLM